MDLVVLGGTAYLGRYVTQAALARGHRVTCLARGTSGQPPEGAVLVPVDRDQDGALSPVSAKHWDSVIDVARHPGHVRRAVSALAGAAGHYVFVSTGNVYADHRRPGLDESAPTLPPLDGEVMTDMSEYGAAKVACENHVLAGFGPGRSLIARSGLIGGPDDRSGRSGYWPWRFAHPSNPEGRVLVPDTPELRTQVIDVRDLAQWLVRCAERRTAGVYDAVGHTVRMHDHLALAREVARHTGPLVPVSSAWLAAHEVAEFMGPRSLPLWLHDPGWLGFTHRRGEAARTAGLHSRPLRETLEAALASESERPTGTPRGAGLTDDEERDLLARVPADG
ncbi:MAG TPA: NAD-dependent epimerase/dehydratase family protein [Candidatus Lustribacter sp.]|nr:NAD-dependent epimerase/dehydratase family protein [Candidatus Lustribacter sp.]